MHISTNGQRRATFRKKNAFRQTSGQGRETASSSSSQTTPCSPFFPASSKQHDPLPHPHPANRTRATTLLRCLLPMNRNAFMTSLHNHKQLTGSAGQPTCQRASPPARQPANPPATAIFFSLSLTITKHTDALPNDSINPCAPFHLFPLSAFRFLFQPSTRPSRSPKRTDLDNATLRYATRHTYTLASPRLVVAHLHYCQQAPTSLNRAGSGGSAGGS
ncbi:hypothetical protein HDK77DRAFT_25923 [Phyllosticta capitalensis]